MTKHPTGERKGKNKKKSIIFLLRNIRRKVNALERRMEHQMIDLGCHTKRNLVHCASQKYTIQQGLAPLLYSTQVNEFPK